MTTATVDPYGTDLICDVLTAYRRDLERTPDVVRFGDDDARWLQLALQVERLTAPATGRVRRGSRWRPTWRCGPGDCWPWPNGWKRPGR